MMIGDYTTQYIGDCNDPIGESLSTNQYNYGMIEGFWTLPNFPFGDGPIHSCSLHIRLIGRGWAQFGGQKSAESHRSWRHHEAQKSAEFPQFRQLSPPKKCRRWPLPWRWRSWRCCLRLMQFLVNGQSNGANRCKEMGMEWDSKTFITTPDLPWKCRAVLFLTVCSWLSSPESLYLLWCGSGVPTIWCLGWMMPDERHAGGRKEKHHIPFHVHRDSLFSLFGED